MASGGSVGDAGAAATTRSRPGAFARAWAKAVSGTSYLPMTQAQLEVLLQRLTERLALALRADPFDLRIGTLEPPLSVPDGRMDGQETRR